MMKFSIVIAVFNRESTIKRCLDSILSQDYSNYEIIVIDGGSTDGTTEVIKNNSSQLAYWISEPDKGIYDAWNKALDKVQGDWIYFLGSDDMLHDDRVLDSVAKAISSLEKRELPATVRAVMIGS